MGTFSKDLQTYVSPKFNEAVLIQTLQEIYKLKDIVIDDIIYDTNQTKGDSYLSIVLRFTVKASGKHELKGATAIELPVVAKTLPKNVGHRKTFRCLDFFKNEVNFYNKVWKALNDFQLSKTERGIFTEIPLCVSALADGVNDYVILEDLNCEGYAGVPRSNGVDLDHTKLILDLFARFHALSLAFKDQEPKKFEKVASSLEETYFAEKFRGWYGNFLNNNLYPVVKDAVEKELAPSYLPKLNSIFEKDLFGRIIKQCERRGPFNVITHGDAWIPNFLMRYNDGVPVSVKMIDFQLARCGSLAFDISFFLYTCTEKRLWSLHWDELILYYHQKFTETLEHLSSSADLLTLEGLKTEIKNSAVLGVAMSMEAIVMSMLEEDEVADLDKINEDKEVPLEEVWVIHPFASKEKRQRLANMFQHAVDNGFV